jgi:hypothetical protein
LLPYNLSPPFTPAAPSTFLIQPRQVIEAVTVLTSIGRLLLMYIPETSSDSTTLSQKWYRQISYCIFQKHLFVFSIYFSETIILEIM